MTNVVLIALAPVFIILFYVYFRDKYEKEPVRMLLTGLILGALITMPVVVIEHSLSEINPFNGDLLSVAWISFVVAGFSEELFKFLAVYLLIWRNRNFNERFDGIVYAVFVSLGFAAVENVLYVSEYGLQTGLIRAFTAIPAHALFGVVMGYFLGMARFTGSPGRGYMKKAIFIPVVLHGIYDFLILSQIPVLLLLFLPYVFWLYRSGMKKMASLNTDFANEDQGPAGA